GGATDIASEKPPIVDDNRKETTCAERYALLEHIFDDTPLRVVEDSISACAAPAGPRRSDAQREHPPRRTAPARSRAAAPRHPGRPEPWRPAPRARGHASATWPSHRI